MRFSLKNLASVFAIGLLIVISWSFAVEKSFALTPPPPPCTPQTIDEEKILKDFLDLPQMAPLSEWKLTKYTMSKCAESTGISLHLEYELPTSFSSRGIQYVEPRLDIDITADTGYVDTYLLDGYNKSALGIRNLIQKAENDNRVKEFIDKVGVDYAYIVLATYDGGSNLEYRKNSPMSGIDYYESGRIDYSVPVDMAWQNFPEISYFQSIFRKEIPNEECQLDFSHGIIQGHSPDGKNWGFMEGIKRASGCPTWIKISINEDKTYTATVSKYSSPKIEPPKVESPKETIQIKDSDDIFALLIEQKQIKSVERIKLSEDQKQYTVIGLRAVKLFGFIPATMKIQLLVNAVTGAIEKTIRPWWSFLAR